MALRKALDVDRSWIVDLFERGIAEGEIFEPGTPPGRLVARAIHGLPTSVEGGAPSLLQLDLFVDGGEPSGFALIRPLNQRDREILALGLDGARSTADAMAQFLTELIEGSLRRCTVIAARTPALEGELALALADRGFRSFPPGEEGGPVAWELVLPSHVRRSLAAGDGLINMPRLSERMSNAMTLGPIADSYEEPTVVAEEPGGPVTGRRYSPLFGKDGSRDLVVTGQSRQSRSAAEEALIRRGGGESSMLREFCKKLLSGLNVFTIARSLGQQMIQATRRPNPPEAPPTAPEAMRELPKPAMEPLVPPGRQAEPTKSRALDNINLKA